MEYLHRRRPKGLKEILQTLEVDHSEVAGYALIALSFYIPNELMPYSALGGVIDGSSLLVAGNDARSDAGLTCFDCARRKVIVRHIVFADIARGNGDVGKIDSRAVYRNFARERYTLSGIYKLKRGVRFLLPVDDLIFDNVRAAYLVRAQERLVVIGIVYGVGAGIAAVCLGKGCDKTISQLLFDLERRVALMIGGNERIVNSV